MKVSLNWLRRYVDITKDPEILAHDLTMFGLNVEEVLPLTPAFEGIVFGRVLDVVKHPKADKLVLCTVDTGEEEPLLIVCGAPNVLPGIGVPVAVHGAVLPGGFKIKRTKIRGEASEGMICSEKELAIGENVDGIMVLDFEEKPGTDLTSRLGSDDVILDIEVTPNRPDQLCHFGIAREIAALYSRPLMTPDFFGLGEDDSFDLSIENGEDCPRYSAAFIDNVKVAPSPPWMQELLKAVGIKPIINIVDVTNFVLMELGQPLHAFDRDALERDSVIVRRAKDGEILVTLDGEKRELDSGILVIADAERPVALAGVMGGEETEVTDKTSRVLLESAMFDPRLIRRARQRFKLETEASYRFEREGDIGITKLALERTCRLLEEVGAGRPIPSCRDLVADGRKLEKRTVTLRAYQANRLMGTHLSASDLASLLERLGLVSVVSDEQIEVEVPTFRRDISQEVDLIEETARLYGYEMIGHDTPASIHVFSARPEKDIRNNKICSYLAARGFAEVVTTSFMDPGDPERLGFEQADRRSGALKIENPLSASSSLLRTSLLPGALNVVRRNIASENEGIRIFELGKIFLPEKNGKGLPDEELHLVVVFAGNSGPLQWLEQTRPFDFFDMKGELDCLLQRFGVDPWVLEISNAGMAVDGFIFEWLFDGQPVAEGGKISKGVASRYEIDDDIFYFDISIDALEGVGARRRYNDVSPYPVVKRDLCLIASEKVTYADITNLIKKRVKFLESISLFDYYRGGHLGEGERSYTFRLSFRSPKGTLDDDIVDAEIEKVLDGLKRDLRVILRAE
jgi:phenylalanyl-tRNA synthetase beta chain